MNYNIPYNYIYSIVQDDDIASIIDRIISRMENKNDIYDEIINSINDELIWYEDHWNVLKFYYYTDIRNANYDEALDNLVSLIATIINKYNRKEVK